MAHQKDDKQRTASESSQDGFYFEDDLESVISGLPTEAEQDEPEGVVPAPEDYSNPTEGFSSTGIRMVGLGMTRPQVEGSEEDAEQVQRAPRPARPSMEFYMDEDLASERTFDEPIPVHTVSPEEGEDAQIDRGYSRATVPQRESKEKKGKQKKTHPVLRAILTWAISVCLLGVIGIMALSRTMYQGNSALQLPERIVSSAVSPVQTWFAGITQDIADYFYMVRLRANWEAEYNRVVSENMELAQSNARVAELEKQLAQFTNMQEEIASNENMNPLAAQVIAKEQGSYFSVFTINKGSRDGVEEYMAVTISGALVGYTETVYDTTSTVRTIIDSDASIAGMIQSSRDQGIISGTLGIDGTALCRMYYLPDDSLPRPGDQVITSGVGFSFPKGIPIGTVRESTRGMEENKQYVVIEPQTDFQHLEYVIVLRYKPEAEAIEGRDTTAIYNEYVPLMTARPYPTLKIGSTMMFGATATPSAEPSITPTPTPSPTPSATPTVPPVSTPRPTVYEYNSTLLNPTATPTMTPTPTPVPATTLRPDDMVWEE